MKKLTLTKFGRLLAGAVFVLGGVAAQAASITMSPRVSLVELGNILEVDISGVGFDEGTIGGGFSLSWDPSVIQLTSATLTFAGDQTFGDPGVIAAGSWTNADVTSFNGTDDAIFDIASLSFMTVGAGVSLLDLEIGTFAGGSDRIWADASGFNDTNPGFIDGIAEVTEVPLPAAAWLFGSALLGLGAIKRRKA